MALGKEIYDLIRSPEVRDFYREHVTLDIYEQENLILRSFIPLEQKLQYLKGIEQEGRPKDAHRICRMRKYLESCLEQIYSPTERSLFELNYCKPYLKGTVFYDNGGMRGFYDTFGEIIAEMEQDYRDEKSRKAVYGSVSLIQIPEGQAHREPFYFHIFWLDGKWQIKDICTSFSDKEEQALVAGRSTVERLNETGVRYPLPFEHGCRLKLQLPFMEAPFCGTLWSEKDGNGCWYHFLYSDNDPEQVNCDFIDLSYSGINCGTEYNSWDWIERE
jgi:hypothetical protein